MPLVPCPHCGKDIDLDAISTTQDGFRVGTKGARIASWIREAGEEGVARTDLMQKCMKYYGDPSAARVSSVIHKMQRREQVVMTKKKVTFGPPEAGESEAEG